MLAARCSQQAQNTHDTQKYSRARHAAQKTETAAQRTARLNARNARDRDRTANRTQQQIACDTARDIGCPTRAQHRRSKLHQKTEGAALPLLCIFERRARAEEAD